MCCSRLITPQTLCATYKILLLIKGLVHLGICTAQRPSWKNAAQVSLRRSAQTETPPAIHLRMPAAAASTDPPVLPFKEAKELAANARTSSDSSPPAQQLHAAAWLIPSIGRTATTHEIRAQCSRRKKPLRHAVLRRAMRSSAVLWENLHRGQASMQVFRMIQV